LRSPDAGQPSATAGELADVLARFAADRCGDYAPLYAHLGSQIAGDPELLAISAHARPGQSQPDLMLAAVHYLLAREPGSRLARYYPTLSPDPDPPGGAFPDFRDFCLAAGMTSPPWWAAGSCRPTRSAAAATCALPSCSPPASPRRGLLPSSRPGRARDSTSGSMATPTTTELPRSASAPAPRSRSSASCAAAPSCLSPGRPRA
jgi:hypothetical protein